DADRTVEAIGGELGSGGEFQKITPDRIYDSRDLGGALPMDVSETAPTVDVKVVGVGGLPPFVDDDRDGQDDNVLAVVANITVIQPTRIGFLRAFGTGATEGTTSVVNFFPGTVIPNTAILRPGDNGKISLRLVSPTGPGTAHIAVDITGWFSTSSYGTPGYRVVDIDPIRVYDSELDQFGGATLKGQSQIEVPIRGAAEVSKPGTPVVPNNDNIVGVIANITGVNIFPQSRPTYISALPEPVANGDVPDTSTVNLVTGQTRANMAILPIGADGSIHLFNLQGEVRMVVDVVAYLQSGVSPDTKAGRVVPLVAPFRAFDTREDEFGDMPLGPAEAEDWSFESFVNDVRIDGEPVGAQSALIGNLTATDLRRQYHWAPVASFLTAYPSPGSGTAVPLVSNVNIVENDTVPNLALLPYGTSSEGPYSIRFYNRAGYVDYLLDVYAVILDD
ncbi:MAG TPA: hypothetical protein VFD31_08920, partial [Thermoleophilaceae bacterium]|nr:hypothetical protein [Thermoleophilaceae bacterium]